MEPEEGPEFCASFEIIFGHSFWPLVHHLETTQEANMMGSDREEDSADGDENCNTDLDSPGMTTDDLPDFQALFGQGNDVPSPSRPPPGTQDAVPVQERPNEGRG